MTTFKWLVPLFVFLASEAFALETNHILWDKTPIAVQLSLENEQIIHFPKPISIIDNEAGENLAVLKVKDTLYLKGKDAFHKKRLIVQLMPQGEVVILNLSAGEKTLEGKALDILLENSSQDPSKTDPAGQVISFDVNAITLTRFAIQSLYSPQRLVNILEGINRIPMQTRRQISLYSGASIEARPLISWQRGLLYITAVELKNLLNKEVTIDPRHLVGHWQTATFYPTNTLAPRSHEDTTTVFLISDKPFANALAEAGEYVR
ncbi:TIGR03749 family integrating conjugative element protein [Legionella maceachernii]|uniref:Integrating conjugative element protein, PFL_4704 family n=1 Tax=Legionella maceachernii TaxID=466 RepID=A0A0W0VVQ1_9GAMM|nr:TIGR03749 family integrating conjugative element protein [Legionella maceachernii]KTD23929.1 hypothetical protein Lmac_2802 [Legionella maceachernii]SKA18348.1 integrating conjugative element protein, PFL_4704 family [Legionella maceachernii]SUP04518.1 integrating conjugative element protein, PFL_4704 family [Legionella maceachernii]